MKIDAIYLVDIYIEACRQTHVVSNYVAKLQRRKTFKMSLSHQQQPDEVQNSIDKP